MMTPDLTPARLPKATQWVHALLNERLGPGDIAIDATCGNGHDTLHLARLVGPSGRVVAIDRQAQAIMSAQRRLTEAGAADWVEWHTVCHSQLARLATAAHAVVLNLGYLPNGDKALITQPETTITALEQAAAILQPGGILTVTAYAGHPGGAEEAAAVDAWMRARPQEQFRCRALWLRQPAQPSTLSLRGCQTRRPWPRLDGFMSHLLSRLTNFFALWVVVGTAWAFAVPQSSHLVPTSHSISARLGDVGDGTHLTH